MALDLLADHQIPKGVATHGYQTGGDFLDLAGRLRMIPRRAAAMLERVVSSRESVLELVDRSFLTDPAKDAYKALFLDRMKALAQTAWSHVTPPRSSLR